MGDHYFSANPGSVSAPRKVNAVLRGRSMSFVTDRGVFSKRGVDYGAALLAEALPVPPAACVLDLGCGYGPVGIAIALTVSDARVWLIDINPRAVELARQNARIAGVEERVAILQADGTDGLDPQLMFDVVALNPPIRAGKSAVWKLYRQACNRLYRSGELYVVIQKKQGAESSETHLRTLFADVSIVERGGGYRVLRCHIPLPPGDKKILPEQLT